MTAREFLNQHIGHSATVEWERDRGSPFISQQRVSFSAGRAALESAKIADFCPGAMFYADLDGPLIALDRIRVVYCCGKHWSTDCES